MYILYEGFPLILYEMKKDPQKSTPLIKNGRYSFSLSAERLSITCCTNFGVHLKQWMQLRITFRTILLALITHTCWRKMHSRAFAPACRCLMWRYLISSAVSVVWFFGNKGNFRSYGMMSLLIDLQLILFVWLSCSWAYNAQMATVVVNWAVMFYHLLK